MNNNGKHILRASDAGGFTMVEVIVTILIAAIMGTIAIQFSGTSLSMSARTVDRIKKTYVLNDVMEQITRDYRIWVEKNPSAPIDDFLTAIKSNEDYSGYIDESGSPKATGTGSDYFVDSSSGADETIELLQLTLVDADGTQRLVALFTQ